MMKTGALARLGIRAAVAAIAVAASGSQAAAAIRDGPPTAMRWGKATGYSLEATIRARSADCAERRRSDGRNSPDMSMDGLCVAQNQTGSDWRVGQQRASYASPRRTGLRHVNMETVPVTVLGRRFVLSHFTVTRQRVRLMISTDF